MECERCEHAMEVHLFCEMCHNRKDTSVADLVAELRARGHFALDKDAPEVVAVREALSHAEKVARDFANKDMHDVWVADSAVDVCLLEVCRAAGVIG